MSGEIEKLNFDHTSRNCAAVRLKIRLFDEIYRNSGESR